MYLLILIFVCTFSTLISQNLVIQDSVKLEIDQVYASNFNIDKSYHIVYNEFKSEVDIFSGSFKKIYKNSFKLFYFACYAKVINFVLTINKLKNMHSKLTKISKEQIENIILPLLPKNKRGFSSRFNPVAIIQSIIHKLKTGCQWRNLFADIEGVKYEFSYQTVFHFYRKWCKTKVWEKLYLSILELQKDKLDT